MAANKQDLYSYHVFLFPFQWQYCGKDHRDKNFEEKTHLKYFCEQLASYAPKWRRRPLTIESRLIYNEYNYFYDFVRDILYDQDPKNQYGSSDLPSQDDVLAHFEYDIPEDSERYIIQTGGKHYELLIENIFLHLYNTGIGVLSFHLNNREPNQADPESILKINQFGRRLYPPFLALEMNRIGTLQQSLPGLFNEGLKICQYVELPQSIGLSFLEHEDFSHYAEESDFKKGVFRLPSFISGLMGKIPIITRKSDESMYENQIFLNPVLDDRMFVVCWYGNNDIVSNLSKDGKLLMSDGQKFDYLKDEWLYRFAYCDINLSCQNDQMIAKALKDNVNARWGNYGTFFAASRYSFVCLTNELSTLRANYAAFVLNHLQTMYYKIAELCLVQRSCIIRFSDEVSNISALNPAPGNQLAEKVSSLYKQYIRFVNRIYFREVTAQEQGIELYQLLQDNMRIENHVKDLDTEIQELHNYLLMEEQRKQNRVIGRLTIIAAVFLPATLFSGILGMNDLQAAFLDEGNKINSLIFNLAFIATGLVLGIIIAYRHQFVLSKLTRTKN